MIPGMMVDFLARASVAFASTRDAALNPTVLAVTGWNVTDDRRSITCLLPESFTDGLVGAIENNGHLTLVAEVIGPHECYQFKGRYDGSRPVTDDDREIHEACRERFVAAVRRLTGDRFSEEALRLRFREPVVAVHLAVEEIYVQTPGPGAGGRLFPPAER